MTSRRPKAWALAALALVASLIAAGIYLTYSSVLVLNQSRFALSTVELSLAGDSLWSGTLASGAGRKFYDRVRKDGVVSISFAADGRVYQHDFGYVTAGPGESHVIVIAPDLTVQYSER